jgi:hypothetical protein
MSAPMHARDDESDAAGGAGGAGGATSWLLPVVAACIIIISVICRSFITRAVQSALAYSSKRRPVYFSDIISNVLVQRLTPEEEDDAYERRLKLTDVIGFVALNGYARETDACAGLCRETWRCIPAGLSAADADCVRRDRPLWQAIIDLKHGERKETRLSVVVFFGRLSRVRELCDWRADIEAADEDGLTPLCKASKMGRIAVVRELLARGANIEAVTNAGWTSLLVASKNGHLDVVRELLARSANIGSATNDGWTSLHAASKEGYLGIVRDLLARGANANAATTLGATPLIQASWFGHIHVVRALLAAGADKRHMQNNGHTATSRAGTYPTALPGSRAAILTLLAAAP